MYRFKTSLHDAIIFTNVKNYRRLKGPKCDQKYNEKSSVRPFNMQLSRKCVCVQRRKRRKKEIYRGNKES